jgi:hypothetical protein
MLAEETTTLAHLLQAGRDRRIEMQLELQRNQGRNRLGRSGGSAFLAGASDNNCPTQAMVYFEATEPQAR